MVFFSFRFHVADKSFVGCRDLFGIIVNLLPHLELLMYAKPISFLVGSNNVYGIIFYQVYLLPWITIPLVLYLAAVSPQHIYQDMQKVCCGFLKWIFPGLILVTSSLPIVFVSFSEVTFVRCSWRERSLQIPFQYSGPLLVIWSISSNVNFGDTRWSLVYFTLLYMSRR